MTVIDYFHLENNLCAKRTVYTLRLVVYHRPYFYGGINMALKGRRFDSENKFMREYCFNNTPVFAETKSK